ncbi:MAG: hypothetical protein AAFP20_20660, partial [Cyanobacteria bacterium J06614_10]
AASGLEFLICDSLTDYEQKAVYLATHPDVVTFLRRGLRESREKLSLFQLEKWVGNLESVYWDLWRQSQTCC